MAEIKQVRWSGNQKHPHIITVYGRARRVLVKKTFVDKEAASIFHKACLDELRLQVRTNRALAKCRERGITLDVAQLDDLERLY